MTNPCKPAILPLRALPLATDVNSSRRTTVAGQMIAESQYRFTGVCTVLVQYNVDSKRSKGCSRQYKEWLCLTAAGHQKKTGGY